MPCGRHHRVQTESCTLLQAGAEDAKGVAPVGGRKPQRFIPFSQGSRDCVGQTLARLNLATTLAQLFGNFSFKLAAEVGRAVHLCMHGLESGRNVPLSSCAPSSVKPLVPVLCARPCAFTIHSPQCPNAWLGLRSECAGLTS